MTREEYIILRNQNSPQIMYEFYKEHHKGGFFLDIMTFMDHLRQWPPANEAYWDVLTHYDHKFTVASISIVKTGQVIRYI